jgi:hypothetical protein
MQTIPARPPGRLGSHHGCLLGDRSVKGGGVIRSGRPLQGMPQGVQPPVGDGPDGALPWAAWAGPHTIYVMTWGSGSCPRIPTSVDARSAEVVVIRTVEHDFIQGDRACTADLAITTSVVRLPARAVAAPSLQVQMDGTTTRLRHRLVVLESALTSRCQGRPLRPGDRGRASGRPQALSGRARDAEAKGRRPQHVRREAVACAGALFYRSATWAPRSSWTRRCPPEHGVSGGHPAAPNEGGLGATRGRAYEQADAQRAPRTDWRCGAIGTRTHVVPADFWGKPAGHRARA